MAPPRSYATRTRYASCLRCLLSEYRDLVAAGCVSVGVGVELTGELVLKILSFQTGNLRGRSVAGALRRRDVGSVSS